MEVIRQAIVVSDMEKDMNDFSNRLSGPFNPCQRYRFYLKKIYCLIFLLKSEAGTPPSLKKIDFI